VITREHVYTFKNAQIPSKIPIVLKPSKTRLRADPVVGLGIQLLIGVGVIHRPDLGAQALKMQDFTLTQTPFVLLRSIRDSDITFALRGIIVHLRKSHPGCSQRSADFSRKKQQLPKSMNIRKSLLWKLFDAIDDAGRHRRCNARKRFPDRAKCGSVCAGCPGRIMMIR
jgi:hypothetical protein